jgi:hypothetical protein
MYLAVAIFIVSAASLLFYLQATCEEILRRRSHEEFYHSIVNANRLEFPFVRAAVEEYDAPVDYGRFRMQLKCDFLALTYLLRNAVNSSQRLSSEEKRLVLYFRGLFLLLAFGHVAGVGERLLILKLTSVLQFFSNVLGERVSKMRFGDISASEYLLSL